MGTTVWADGIDIPENISRGIDLNRTILWAAIRSPEWIIDMARKETSTRKLEEVFV